MGSAPVTDHHSIETPLSFKDVVQSVLVLAAPLVLVKIVGTHYRPSLPLGDGCLEGRKIDLIESPVINCHIGGEAVIFLIVQREMLHAGSHAVALHTLDIRHDHAA